MKKVLNFFRLRLITILVDLFAIPIAWYGAYWLRFNARSIPQGDFLQALYILPFLIGIQFFSFSFFGLYRSIWGFASLPDFIRILKSVLVGVVCSVIVLFFLHFQVPRVVIPIYAWLLVSLLGGTRLLYRWYKQYYRAGFKEGKRVLVVGAGEAADLLRKYEVMYDVAHDCLEVKTLTSVPEELFLELIEKLPVSSVKVSSRRKVTEALIKADDVYQSITKRMLDALRNNKGFSHRERSIFLDDVRVHAPNKEKELKKADEILNDLGAGTEWTAVALISGNPNFYEIVLQSK